MNDSPKTQTTSNAYTWQSLKAFVFQHKRSLIFANVIAIIATLFLVPIPLLMPVLVDEVLLDNPGSLLATANSFLPKVWQTPTAYIIFFTVLTLLLRVGGLSLLVLQTRAFTLVAKDITYKIRKDLLARVNSISMSEYETLGSGTISSHFVVDVETIDKFISETVSKFIVAILLIIGIIAVLFWLHWKLALIIIFLNPLVVLITLKMGKYIKELKRNENSAFSIFQQSLTETLDGIQQIRASNREQFFFSRLANQAKQVRDHSAQFSWKSDAASRLSFLVFLTGFDIFRAIAMVTVVLSISALGRCLPYLATYGF